MGSSPCISTRGEASPHTPSPPLPSAPPESRGWSVLFLEYFEIPANTLMSALCPFSKQATALHFLFEVRTDCRHVIERVVAAKGAVHPCP
jgi:hypothetical protein